MKVYIDDKDMLRAWRDLRTIPFKHIVGTSDNEYFLSPGQYEKVKDYARTEENLRHASEREALLDQLTKERLDAFEREFTAYIREEFWGSAYFNLPKPIR